MVRVSSPAKLRPWSELTAKMVMGVVPGLVRESSEVITSHNVISTIITLVLSFFTSLLWRRVVLSKLSAGLYRLAVLLRTRLALSGSSVSLLLSRQSLKPSKLVSLFPAPYCTRGGVSLASRCRNAAVGPCVRLSVTQRALLTSGSSVAGRRRNNLKK